MRIAVSACLIGENCKYSGGNNYSEKVIDYIKGNEVLSVCPEVLGGLPVPRESAEIVNGIVSHKDGTSVDKEFRKGAKKALETDRLSGKDSSMLITKDGFKLREDEEALDLYFFGYGLDYLTALKDFYTLSPKVNVSSPPRAP